jgi:hypothetical protein
VLRVWGGFFDEEPAPFFCFHLIASSLNLYLKVRIFDTLRMFYSLGRTKNVSPLFMKEL